MPDSIPEFSGFDIQHWHMPFEGIPGGDFIDYFNIDENHLAVILGDVMGKKWGAWYFAFAYAGYVRSALRGVFQSSGSFSPSVLLNEVNRSVFNDAKVSEVFSTISVVILNNKDFTATYTGAGDLPLLYKNKNENKVVSIKSKGMLLGFALNGEYEDTVIELKANDALILTTDGIIETRNRDNQQFGSARLMELINSIPDEQDILENIKHRIKEFANSNYEDDISLISLRVK